jgi:endonuclease/exonuclease/phosphatase family metal-dependent hydrolase
MSPLWTIFIQSALAQDELRVETYNVGLAHGFVDSAAERTPLIAADLAADTPDILCLQEAWTEDDRETLIEASTYPYSYLLPVEQRYADDAPACRRKELFGEDRFASCMSSSCDGLKDDALTDCIVSRCGPVLGQLRDDNPQCANAVMAQVGKPALKAIWTVMRPIRRANMYAYGGSDGLVMLSQHPLSEIGVVDFSDIATLNRRRALYAELTVAGQDLRVYCTHLTADLDSVAPYPGAFDGWGAENLAQVDRLLEHAADHDGPVAILGDFNTGPALEAHDITSELPESHDRFIAAGYTDPAQLAALCTYCGDNTLNEPEAGQKLIDHAYLRGIDARDGARTRDTLAALPDGTPISLSDHYGYATTLYFAPEPEPEPEPEPDSVIEPEE